MKRQKMRKALLLIAFLLFPVTIWYFSPYLIILAASEHMIADLDRTEKTWFFKLVEGSGNASLKMDYNGTALVWKYGDQPDSPAGEGAVG